MDSVPPGEIGNKDLRTSISCVGSFKETPVSKRRQPEVSTKGWLPTAASQEPLGDAVVVRGSLHLVGLRQLKLLFEQPVPGKPSGMIRRGREGLLRMGCGGEG